MRPPSLALAATSERLPLPPPPPCLPRGGFDFDAPGLDEDECVLGAEHGAPQPVRHYRLSEP